MVKSRRTKLNVRNRSAKKRTFKGKRVQRAGSIRRTKLNVRNRSAKKRTLKRKRVQRAGSLRRTKLNVRGRGSARRTLTRKRVQRAGGYPKLDRRAVDQSFNDLLSNVVREDKYILFTLYRDKSNSKNLTVAFINRKRNMVDPKRFVEHQPHDKFTMGNYLKLTPTIGKELVIYQGELILEPEPKFELNVKGGEFKVFYVPLEILNKIKKMDREDAEKKLNDETPGTYLLRVGTAGIVMSLKKQYQIVHLTLEQLKNLGVSLEELFNGKLNGKTLTTGGEEITLSMLEHIYDTRHTLLKHVSVEQEELFPYMIRKRAETILKPFTRDHTKKGLYILRTNTSRDKKISYIDSKGKIKHGDITDETFRRFNVAELNGKEIDGVTFQKYEESEYDSPAPGPDQAAYAAVDDGEPVEADYATVEEAVGAAEEPNYAAMGDGSAATEAAYAVVDDGSAAAPPVAAYGSLRLPARADLTAPTTTGSIYHTLDKGNDDDSTVRTSAAPVVGTEPAYKHHSMIRRKRNARAAQAAQQHSATQPTSPQASLGGYHAVAPPHSGSIGIPNDEQNKEIRSHIHVTSRDDLYGTL